jgi:hypothetical protein
MSRRITLCACVVCVAAACRGFVAVAGPFDELPPSDVADGGRDAISFPEDAGDADAPGDHRDAMPTACADGASPLYVVTGHVTDSGPLVNGFDLQIFDTTQFVFTEIGPIVCPIQDAQYSYPTSLAVDREGGLWLSYSTGDIFRVRASDAQCSATGFVPGQEGFQGGPILAFASDGTDSGGEALYAGDKGGRVSRGLGRIDARTLSLTRVGPFGGPCPGTGNAPIAMTAMSDGRLFAMFSSSPLCLAQVDPGTGYADASWTGPWPAAVNVVAFSRGVFWIFSDPAGPLLPTATAVSQYQLGGTVIAPAGSSHGFATGAAGASTCPP